MGPLSQELLLVNYEVEREFPYRIWKLDMMGIPNMKKNSPGTFAMYHFCFTEFMREILHTFSKMF